MKILISLVLLTAIFSNYRWVNSVIDQKIDQSTGPLKLSTEVASLKSLSPMNEYESIATRPLFDEDRKPARQVIVAKKIEKKVVRKDLVIQALGIALVGDKFLAVIKDLKTGKVLRLRINDSIYGWKLSGVSENSLIFSRADLEKIIKFRNN